MKLEKILENLDTKEPILVEWALDRIKDKREIEPDTLKQIESKVFHDDALLYMLNHFDSWMLVQIFQILPAQRFSNHVQILIQKWPEWEDTTAREAAPVIAQLDPAGAAEIFGAYCENKAQFEKFNTWRGVFNSLDSLSKTDAAAIAQKMTQIYLTALTSKKKVSSELGFTGSIRETYSLYILELTWRFDLTKFEIVLYQCLRYASRSMERYSEDLIRLSKILGFSDQDCRLISEFISGYLPPMPSEFKFFYHETIPFEELDKGVKNLQKGSIRFLPDFFDTYKNVIQNERIRLIFEQILQDKKFLDTLDKKKQLPFLYGMIFSALLSSLKKEKIDLSECSVKEVIRLASIDIESLPDMDEFFAFFKKQDKNTVIRGLSQAAKSAENFGRIHILKIMGMLGYEEFLGPLTDALASDVELDPDDIYDIVENILLKQYKDQAVRFFSDHFSQIDDMTKLSALSVARKLGSPESVNFIDKHFKEFLKIEKEFIMEAIQAICDEKYLEWLRPKVNKRQELIDEAYLVISLLTQKKRSPEIKSLLKKCYKRKAREQKLIHDILFHGEIPDIKKKNYIDAELECKICGDTYVYRLNRILIGDKGNPYIAEEIECLNCRALSEFNFTPKGMMSLTGEMMRVKNLKPDEKTSHPLQFVKTGAFGKEMDIDEAIHKYQELTRTYPNDATNYIGLGNVYYHMGQPTKAGVSYRKAIETDPAYLQSYYVLAQMADNSGDPEAAIDFLERGKPYLGSWKYMPSAGLDEETFVQLYCDLYNSLVKERNHKKSLLGPSDFNSVPFKKRNIQMPVTSKKIGRNDPCPCGSGKKYKKCCLNK